MSPLAQNRRATRNRTRSAIAALAVLAISGSVVVGSATAANAAPEDALTTSVVKADGTPVAPGEVIPEGASLKLRIQYQKFAAPDDLTGTSHTIQLGTGVTVGAPPAGNTAVTGIAANGNGIDITFADPWPAGVNQGYIELDFSVDDVTESGVQDITWMVGSESNSLSIVVRDESDVFENIGSESFNKAVTPNNLNSHVQVGASATDPNETVFLGLNSSVIGVPLTYTLTVELPAATDGTGFSIEDALPAGLSYVPGSFVSTLTTWDANGWNQQVTTLDATSTPAAFAPTVTGTGTAGQEFTGSIDLPTPSVLTITYVATIADEASRLVVEAALQDAADALGGNSGTFTHPLTNAAQFDGGSSRSATVNLRGTIPGPCTTGCAGAAFSKNASGGSVSVIADGNGLIVDEAGDTAPVDVTYTLSADLSQWDGSNSNYTLDRNVVITDTLVSQLSWNTSAPDFITVTAGTGSPITALTEVTCPVGTDGPIADAATSFNGDAYVGTYCIDGQRILINIGMDADTDVTIALKALLHRVDGLTPSGSSSILGATRYSLPNQAQFWHRNGARSNANAPQYPVRLPDDRDGGLNDSAAFSKQGPSGTVVVNPGDIAYIPYTFTVNTAAAGLNAEEARIEDQLDTSVFDVSDLSLITVTSTYSGVGDISGDVELSLEGDTLIIELADGVTLPAGGTWVVAALIPTYPLVGKQTLDITNYASLFGSGTEPVYWSDNQSRSTSFGDELEVRKHVYDRQVNDWTTALVADVDGAGELVENVYVYRLQLIAHGSFSGAILPVTDLLPAETEFLGFVDEADVADGSPVNPVSPISLGHGIEAEYDATAGPQGQITVYQATGSLPAGGEVAAYFAVQLDPEQPLAVTNSFGGQDASIVPGGPSIDIEKWNDEGESPQYDARGRLINDGYLGDFDTTGKALAANTNLTINFTVSNDGPEALIDIEVTDRLDSGSGPIEDLACTFPGSTEPDGTTWAGPLLPGVQFECEGTLPALQVGQSHRNTATVTGVGALSGITVDDEDEWRGHVPLPATGVDGVAGLALSGLLAVIAGTGILITRRLRPLSD